MNGLLFFTHGNKRPKKKDFFTQKFHFPWRNRIGFKRKLCKLLKKIKPVCMLTWPVRRDTKTNPSFETSITRLRRFPSQPSYRPLKCESSTSHFNTRSPLFLIIVFFIFSNQQPKFVPFFFLQSFEIFNTSDLQRLSLSLLTKKKKVTQFSYLYLCCALVCLLDVLFHCQIVLQIYVYQTWQNLETCCVRWELTSLPG